ncbi:GNAT family N-acetyltransferase [Aporhodopirellula aestuarii]|uniref:GNAT family N-acetyltransferase n=1 Tax=Aporhodopirellula aestuarii TaxID=2950107 RepID=A0ABT0U2Q0_9BACT|nr:GNAT family N-acetyltransferase [Aporhodopirellula aestuarii]MCM2371182.1 GNAT family N-acetyltransferase [Aporhodopirellula aestuarii]
MPHESLAQPVPASTTADGSKPANASITVWKLSTAELATALTHTFDRISPARAGIVTDQLRGILKAQATDRLVVLAASTDPPQLQQSLLAIAMLPESGDTATILHVDWVEPNRTERESHQTVGNTSQDRSKTDSTVGDTGLATGSESTKNQLGESLWQRLSGILAERGIRFLQWATDPASPPSDSTGELPRASANEWPQILHFAQIGTLEYLALDCDGEGRWSSTRGETRKTSSQKTTNAPARDPFSLKLHPLDQDDSDQKVEFEKLVQRTYVDSLDCPPLERFRTVSEIITGYRIVDAYAPDLWYTVRLDHPGQASTGADDGERQTEENVESIIGCVILARHSGSSSRNNEQTNPASVIELVYMGIAPEYRGRGSGQQIMQMIEDVCQQQNAERLILAVDRNNHPAIAAYRGIGMQPLFRETVWGRSLTDAG